MKTRSLLFCLSLVPLLACSVIADDLQALAAADDARVAGFKSADQERLAVLLSDGLHYAHSNGVVDSKTSLIETLVSGKTKYLGFEDQQRDFQVAAPGVALLTGRVRIQAATTGGEVDSVLSFLAVWRLEEGQWRFFAWQSCKLPPAE